MSYIVEFSVPVFLEVEDADAKSDSEAFDYASLQLDNQDVLTVIGTALAEKTSFDLGDNFDPEDAAVNEASDMLNRPSVVEVKA